MVWQALPENFWNKKKVPNRRSLLERIWTWFDVQYNYVMIIYEWIWHSLHLIKFVLLSVDLDWVTEARNLHPTFFLLSYIYLYILYIRSTDGLPRSVQGQWTKEKQIIKPQYVNILFIITIIPNFIIVFILIISIHSFFIWVWREKIKRFMWPWRYRYKPKAFVRNSGIPLEYTTEVSKEIDTVNRIPARI